MNRWLAMMLAVLSLGTAAAQELTATLDRDTIFDGETVRLTVELRGDARGREPDFSPLQRSFFLGDTTNSTQFNIVNNRRDVRTQWSIELEPRGTGNVAIPPLPVGDLVTTPLVLQVLPRGQQTEDDPIFLEMAVDTEAPYVHGQVLLTLKLFHVDALTEGRLVEPALDEAVVERLGEDVTYSSTIGGTRYRVLERRFAVFPERSGAMRIPPASFRGRVADSRSGFNSIFDRGRRVSVAAEPIDLKVRGRPAGFSGELWLPAAEFTLEETWPEGGTELTVGEPATRRIKMQAKGLLSVQLPELTLPEVGSLKIYPDQAQSQSRTDGTWVFGEREQGYAIVPTEAGTLTLPEIRIPWWDTTRDEARVAILPARDVVVLPGVPATAPPQLTPLGDGAASGTVEGTRPVAWQLAAGTFAALWLMTLVAWWRARGRAPAKRREVAPSPRADNHRRRLREACDAGDASLAAAALLGLAREADAHAPTSLGALGRRVTDPELARAIGELDRALYAPGQGHSWDAARLREAARGALELAPLTEARPRPPAALPPLYPETS
ncbi:MAG: BatD family protein [Pseudomonadota bacterium]